MKGLEPPCLAAPDPKSGASTNFATSAKYFLLLRGVQIYYFFKIKLYKKKFGDYLYLKRIRIEIHFSGGKKLRVYYKITYLESAKKFCTFATIKKGKRTSRNG